MHKNIQESGLTLDDGEKVPSSDDWKPFFAVPLERLTQKPDHNLGGALYKMAFSDPIRPASTNISKFDIDLVFKSISIRFVQRSNASQSSLLLVLCI